MKKILLAALLISSPALANECDVIQKLEKNGATTVQNIDGNVALTFTTLSANKTKIESILADGKAEFAGSFTYAEKVLDGSTYCVLKANLGAGISKYVAIKNRTSYTDRVKIFIGGTSMAFLKSQIAEANADQNWFTLNVN